jgi:hypothetical protein
MSFPSIGPGATRIAAHAGIRGRPPRDLAQPLIVRAQQLEQLTTDY